MPSETLGEICRTKERLKFLKWPTSHQKRLISSLTECYNTINSLTGQHSFEYFIRLHRHKLKPLPAKLNSFKYSFVVNLVNNWNNLPEDVAEAETLNIFKNRPRGYFTKYFRKFLNFLSWFFRCKFTFLIVLWDIFERDNLVCLIFTIPSLSFPFI